MYAFARAGKSPPAPKNVMRYLNFVSEKPILKSISEIIVFQKSVLMEFGIVCACAAVSSVCTRLTVCRSLLIKFREYRFDIL